MNASAAVAKRLLAACAPQRVLYRGSRTTGRVALTFDDGPHPEHTARVLEALARADRRATFFLQGSQAAKLPSLVRDIHAQGHQIANHAASHRRPAELGTGAYVSEVEDTRALLCDIVGAPVARDFRPPFGDTSLRTLLQLLQRGYRYVFWSRDSRDSWLKEPQALLAAFEEAPVVPGDIVLFHDDYAQTADALPVLLGQLAERELEAVTVEDLR